MKIILEIEGEPWELDLTRVHTVNDLSFGDEVIVSNYKLFYLQQGKVVGVFDDYITVEFDHGEEGVEWVKITGKSLYRRVYKINE